MENTLIFDHFKEELLANISELRKLMNIMIFRENKRVVT
jgi:hypothetical protein